MSEVERNEVENERSSADPEEKSEGSSLKDECRRFLAAITSSSVRTHIMNYTSLAKTVEHSDEVPEPVIKAIVKTAVSVSLQKYRRPASFKAVAKLIAAFGVKNREVTLRTLAQTIVAQLPNLPNLSPNAGLKSVQPTKWLFELLKESSSLNDDDSKLVTSAIASLSFYASANQKARNVFFADKLKKQLSVDPTLLTVIEKNLPALSKDFPEKTLTLIASIVKATKASFAMATFIEALSKAVLLPKTRPPQHVVDAAIPVFERISSADFNEHLLPVIKKALLRSPEVSMVGVLAVINAVTFSVDPHADDLLKSALGSAQSADEQLRIAAIDVAVGLTKRAQAPVVTKVVNRLFDQFTSAKTPEVKLDILRGIEKVSSAAQTIAEPDVQKLAADVIQKTAKTDTIEAVVEALWSATVAWATRLPDTADSLIVIFKEASKLPSSQKSIGFRSVVNVFTQKGLSSLPTGATVKDLVTEVDTGAKGELSSIPLALLLLKSLPKGSVEHTKVWSRAAHAESLFKEKSMSALKWQDAVIWAQLVEQVILQRPIVDKSAPAKYPTATLNALSAVLFWPHYKVRQQSLTVLETLLSVEKEAFAEAFAEHLYDQIVHGKINTNLRKIGSCPDPKEWTVPGVWYVLVLKKLLLSDGADLDKLAVHTLLLASIKDIVVEDGAVWLRWMHEQKEAKTWEASQAFRKNVLDKVLSCEQREVRDTALLSVVLLNVDSLKEDLWTHVEKSLTQIDIDSYLTITEKQVGVFKCPEGHLYNTDVLDFDEGAGSQNMKRENKAYSYQDQLAEIQLKRELAEKRRKEGKLSAKQKQVMEKELALEKEIRDELKQLYVTAEAALDEARALVEADHAGAFARPLILFNTALPLTKSNLIAEAAAKLFLAYRNAAFEVEYDCCGHLVGSNWLRILGSKWLVDGWKDEELETAVKRMMGLLNERAFFVEGSDEDFQHDEMDIVGAPQLTILYPMIREILTNDDFSDANKNDALQLMQNAINKVFLKNNAVLTVPMEQYATLLLEYFANTNSTPAYKALTQLIELVNESGDVGNRVIGMVREILVFLMSEKSDVRLGAVKVLSAPQLLPRIVIESDDATIGREILIRLFVATYDPIESVADAALDLWQTSKFHVKQTMGPHLVEECVAHSDLVRNSGAKALKEFLIEFPDETPLVLSKIDETYKNLNEVREAVYDNVGRLLQEAIDEWERRSGCAIALQEISTIVREEDAEQLIKIVAPLGIVDRHTTVRSQLTNAAVETINRHGKNIKGRLQPFFEKLSDQTPAGAAHDNRRQGLVVLLGTLAQYLNDSPEKVRAIVARLVEALSTPSQTVQVSVSQCLSPLVPFIKSDARDLVAKLQNILFEGGTYGERRGAAYGIAGLVKGMGVISLKEIDLLQEVTKHLTDKKNAKHREGSLLVLEILCSTVGKFFEPYIIKFLPTLTNLFGDTDQSVRQAADDTAQAMMASLTRFGIKLVLPVLTIALDDDAWRTKCAATEMLGSVAFCAPRQLSACLPSIVPKLIEVLADSSSKVTKSGENALRKIAGVVRNPEILGVVNQLMAGLLDPASKTSAALQAVLNTKFIHYIDAPSLALMMPIVRRAFEDRNSETRRVAAQIIANIYSLTESKDMEPYLANLLPGLQRSLLDPVPDIRTVSAKALGAIVAKAGGKTSQKLHQEVVPWLKEKLISQTSTVDRSGAAQGLCEVLAGVGTDQLDHVMPEIIEATESTSVSAETRDGYILMYIYLPLVFGEKFIPYLPKVVPPILKALADENEYVRASALKAGQRLITQYCTHARKHLLPQLQIGLTDENWRIRHASVQLIGDFLFTISGVSGKSTTSTANEDDTMGMEQAGKTIVRALGQKDRDRVLAGLYLVRSDVALIVRQAAGHVWKIVVSNTPRALKEVMKYLFEMVVDSLASSCEERQQMGARCLGELVRKMGDKVINGILPVLDENQKSEDVSKRVGVAIALHEIIGNMSKEVLNHYLSNVTPPVRVAICDEDSEVREAAANAFSSLYHIIGNEALDEIITPLLEQLTPEQDHVLQGLCEVMKQNSKSMLPYLLPKLTKPPVNIHALCSLASVSGDSLARQLPKVLDAMLASCLTNDQYDPMIDTCEKVVVAVTDEEGVPVLMQYLLKKIESGNVPAAVLLNAFISKSGVSFEESVEEYLPSLLLLYASINEQIVDHVVAAAGAMVKPLESKTQQDMLPPVKKVLNMLISSSKGEQIVGFTRPKALQPLLIMIRENVMNGGNEAKAMAAEAMSQIVQMSTIVALKAYAVNMSGPLIRVLGDRYPPSVKLPILDTLSIVLDKASELLKPFFPQLQSTFMKALQETSSRPVRLAAGSALAKLFPKVAKQEQTLTELTKFLAGSQDLQLTESTLVTLRAMLPSYSGQLTSQIVNEIFEITEGIYSKTIETPTEVERSLVVCSGALLGETLAVTQNWQEVKTRILDRIESPKTSNDEKIAKVYALQQISENNAAALWGSEVNDACRSALTTAFQSTNTIVASSACRTASNILVTDLDRDLLNQLARTINHTSLDVRKVVAVALGYVSKAHTLQNDLLKIIVPHLVNGTKESNSAVRVASETSLIYAFNFIESPANLESYRSTVEPIVQKALDEVRVSMAKIIRNRDTDLEDLNDILSVRSF